MTTSCYEIVSSIETKHIKSCPCESLRSSCGFVEFSRWFVFCWSKGLVSEAWARDPMMCFSFCKQFIIRKCFHCMGWMLCRVCDGGRTEINSGVSRIWSPAGERLKSCQALTEVIFGRFSLSLSPLPSAMNFVTPLQLQCFHIFPIHSL